MGKRMRYNRMENLEGIDEFQRFTSFFLRFFLIRFLLFLLKAGYFVATLFLSFPSIYETGTVFVCLFVQIICNFRKFHCATHPIISSSSELRRILIYLLSTLLHLKTGSN